MKQTSIIIALDGPAGSGKSTTARLVAERLGYVYIDTGAMYRALTLAVIRENADISDEGLKPLLANYTVRLAVEPAPLFASMAFDSTLQHSTMQDVTAQASVTLQRTYLIHKEKGRSEDVSDEIRSQDVTMRVSAVSALATVRAAMVEQQRRMGSAGGVVMDGRDIGTVVFPQAELKVFLVASVEERARRRLRELEAKARQHPSFAVPTFEELCQQLQDRDKQDSERDISPLRKADDAVEIDTSNLSIEAQTARIIELARERMAAASEKN
jgi:cytidylate kinase